MNGQPESISLSAGIRIGRKSSQHTSQAVKPGIVLTQSSEKPQRNAAPGMARKTRHGRVGPPGQVLCILVGKRLAHLGEILVMLGEDLFCRQSLEKIRAAMIFPGVTSKPPKGSEQYNCHHREEEYVRHDWFKAEVSPCTVSSVLPLAGWEQVPVPCTALC